MIFENFEFFEHIFFKKILGGKIRAKVLQQDAPGFATRGPVSQQLSQHFATYVKSSKQTFETVSKQKSAPKIFATVSKQFRNKFQFFDFSKSKNFLIKKGPNLGWKFPFSFSPKQYLGKIGGPRRPLGGPQEAPRRPPGGP